MRRLQAYLRELAAPSTEFELVGLSPPDGFLHRPSETRCGTQVVANLIVACREQDYDAAVVGHFQDPNLWDARSAVEIPVLGLGEGSMLHACSLGHRVGVVTIAPEFLRWHEDQINGYGLERRVVEVAAMRTDVELFMRAFEQSDAYDDVRGQFVEQAQGLAARGVEVVIPAGELPAPLLREEGEFEVDGATILNPIPVLVKQAEAAAALRTLNGTGTSRHSTFARPSEALLDDFLEQLGDHRAPMG